MNFTDLELALLKGAPILPCCGDEIDVNLKNNYEYVDVKKLDNFCVWIGNADWKGKESSVFFRWVDIQKPPAFGESGNGHVGGIYADLLFASDNKVTKSSVSEETYFRSLQCREKCIRMFMQKTTWPTENEASKIVYSLQSFVANVKDFCVLFPESSSRIEWTAKAGFFCNQVKASLDRSIKNILQVPSKYPELMEILATEQQNVEGLSNVGSI